MENKHLDPIRELIQAIEGDMVIIKPEYFESVSNSLMNANHALQLLEGEQKESCPECNGKGSINMNPNLTEVNHNMICFSCKGTGKKPDALESEEFNDFLTILEDAHFKMMECSSFDEDYVRYCEEYKEAVQSFKQFIRNNFK